MNTDENRQNTFSSYLCSSVPHLWLTFRFLIRQFLSDVPDLRTRDGLSAQVRDEDFVEVLAAECEIGRPRKQDRKMIPREQLFFSGRGHSPDLVRGVTGDV